MEKSEQQFLLTVPIRGIFVRDIDFLKKLPSAIHSTMIFMIILSLEEITVSAGNKPCNLMLPQLATC